MAAAEFRPSITESANYRQGHRTILPAFDVGHNTITAPSVSRAISVLNTTLIVFVTVVSISEDAVFRVRTHFFALKP